MSGTGIRPWREGDQAAVEALLDPEPDPLWANQGHRLHGCEREGDRWRRTWLGEQDGRVVGAVTLGANWVHPDRYSLMVEVAPGARRRGVARDLVEHARANRPEPLPMSAKVREGDAAGMAFARRLGAITYLRSPCPVVDTAAPEVGQWCLANGSNRARALSAVADAQWAELFAEQYQWVHAERAPVGSATALAEMARLTVAGADRELSSVVHVSGRVAAVAFVFGNGDGVFECVAETQRVDEPDGIVHLSVAIARSLQRVAERGGTVEFDGHDSDPHLAPVVATLPVVSLDPLLLVTIDAPRSALTRLK